MQKKIKHNNIHQYLKFETVTIGSFNTKTVKVPKNSKPAEDQDTIPTLVTSTFF